MATFNVSEELRALIAGFGSRATANVVLSNSFSTSPEDFPVDPTAIRRSLIYSTEDAGQFNVEIANVDGTSVYAVTVPRGF